MQNLYRYGLFILFLLALGIPSVFAQSPGNFSLTILHNNDGESQLVGAPGQVDFGGAARFKTLVDNLRSEAAATGSVVMLSSGDNFLAGPEFNVSLAQPAGETLFESRVLDLIGYDALALGNHEFDFGPDILERLIRGFDAPTPFLSANLDFSGEPGLQDLVDNGRIAKSTILEKDGEMIGVIGATTPNLTFISSPRNVVVMEDVASAVQAQIDALTTAGVNKIILISHLQGVLEDLNLIPMLSGIDIVIAGGGDELLANDDDLLVPGDESVVFGAYPLITQNAEGVDVPVVTTAGNYKYVGKLVVEFDADGNLVLIDEASGPVRVAGGSEADAVPEDATVVSEVIVPVSSALAALEANIIGTSEVALDGVRNNVRGIETNLGNLITDAFMWQAGELASAFGVPLPDVAIQNGGGIRNDNLIPAGDISELTTFDILPFANFLAVVPNIPADQFKQILENAVSALAGGSGTGRFGQFAGLKIVVDESGTPQQLDSNGNVTVEGSRIVSAVLNDGRVIVANGQLAPAAPSVNIATIDFSARGGDEYPFRGAPFVSLGVTYQQVLANYIADGLQGVIKENDYPESGQGRILKTMVPDVYPAMAIDDLPVVIFERDGVEVRNGGYGSGLSPHPTAEGLFYLLTDRGPNFDGPNAGDKIFPVPGFVPQLGVFKLEGDKLRKISVIPLKDAHGQPISGLPNPVGEGGTGEVPLDLDGNVLDLDAEGLDPEAVVALEDGTFWLSDEYGPHILHVDAYGRTIERINAFGSGTGGRKLPAVFGRRRANRGMEGLTITPDEKTLVGIMQSAMHNPSSAAIGSRSAITRILTFDIETGDTKQYVYVQEQNNLSNSEIMALTDTEFIVLERDGRFPGDPAAPAVYKQFYKISIEKATDVSDPADSEDGLLIDGKTLEQYTGDELIAAGIRPVSKQLVLDLLTDVVGYANDKPEGAFVKGDQLFVVNDDDFGIVDLGGGTIGAKVLPLTGEIDANALYVATLQPRNAGVFSLVDASTDVPVSGFDPIEEGAILDLGALPEGLNITANIPDNGVAAVIFNLNGADVKLEGVAPYALFGDVNGDLTPGKLPVGTHVLSATALDAAGAVKLTEMVSFTVVDGDAPQVTGLTLIDADTNEDIAALVDGATLDLGALPASLNVRADVAGHVKSVTFSLNNGSYNRIENVAPFALFGDRQGDFFGATFNEGENTLLVTPNNQTMANGAAGEPLTISFSVVGTSAGKLGAPRGSFVEPLDGSASEDGLLPDAFALHANYPNPFNPTTTIAFSIPEQANVQLSVFDVLGREVRSLINGQVTAGQHEVSFEAAALPSGAYFYRLVTPAGSFVKQMLLLK